MEQWSKINDLFRLLTKNLDDYDEKPMRIKSNLYKELPLNKTITNSMHDNSISAVFHQNNKYFP